jgi:hypothetical protein
MAITNPDESTDRIVLTLDPGGPIELKGLAESFAGLARIYERHYRPRPELESAPRLFISKLESGSIVAEIVPYIMMFGMAVPYMDGAMVVSDFTKRITNGIRAFSGDGISAPLPTNEDARDLREFVRPLTGRKGSELRMSHARYEKRDGKKKTIIEYKFDEAEINRMALAIDMTLDETEVFETMIDAAPQVSLHDGPVKKEVMLFFHQASRGAGKEEGRTGDKAIIPEVSDKPLPVHFREGIQDLKERMVRGQANPLTSTYVVDVHVQYLDGEPKGYIVTDVHKVIASDD